MNIKKPLIGFVTYFCVTFVASTVVTFLYNLVVHRVGVVDWEIPFQFAIIFGIIFSWTNARESKKEAK